MKELAYLDKEEMELAISLDQEDWISDLTLHQSFISMLIHKYNEGRLSLNQ